MGLSLAGFKPVAVVEWDKWACETIRENQQRGYPLVKGWPLVEGDVREWIASFSPSRSGINVDLVAGGPPCQPFSMGGKHLAFRDDRDMFPSAVEVVRKLRPKAFILENVKGLTRSSFHNYFQYILRQLEYPEISRKPDESWTEHAQRLQKIKSGSKQVRAGLCYSVQTKLLNAANYGVPQKRERVFFVGFRTDVQADWEFPDETHSLDALLYEQWVTGAYWERHRIAKKNRPAGPHQSLAITVDRMRGLRLQPTKSPWRTTRDALFGMPKPVASERSQFFNHKLQTGARQYPGHTGSALDSPAKTLKAGDHGVPGGENMFIQDDGAPRYFSVRESARIQTFPDGYVFHGSWTETMRQLGNAVPVRLAHAVAQSVAVKLAEENLRSVKIFHQFSKAA